MLPQLRKLERRYADTVQVVSVHSPKFPTERETANLRQAVLRLRIEHPVLNDADFQFWQRYGARAWPTIFFIDPRGNVIGLHEGELTEEMATPLIDGWLADYDAADDADGPLLAREPLALTRETGAESALSFPGKVAWDDASGRLVVADTNNDRILVADIEGNVSLVVGGAGAGFEDGDAAAARFNQPQGVAIDGDAIYVADNENHTVRRIDLPAGEVRTIAGTGEQARMLPDGQPARETALSSPWDVAVRGSRLYIAMAGIHQLWSMDLNAGDAAPVAPGPAADAKESSTARASRPSWPSPAASPWASRAWPSPTANPAARARWPGTPTAASRRSSAKSAASSTSATKTAGATGKAPAPARHRLARRRALRRRHLQPQDQAGLPAHAKRPNPARRPRRCPRRILRNAAERARRPLRRPQPLPNRRRHQQPPHRPAGLALRTLTGDRAAHPAVIPPPTPRGRLRHTRARRGYLAEQSTKPRTRLHHPTRQPHRPHTQHSLSRAGRRDDKLARLDNVGRSIQRANVGGGIPGERREVGNLPLAIEPT